MHQKAVAQTGVGSDDPPGRDVADRWVAADQFKANARMTKVKSGKTKNFGYGSILIYFSLERIPLMQPQLVSLGVSGPRDPRMQIWVDLMARHAGQSLITFTPKLFEWLDRQDMDITEYPYSEMDFCEDTDLMLPVGAQWGAIGKLFDQSVF